MMQKPIIQTPVIAHRGAMAGAPENTLAALRLAQKQGAFWAEIDIKITLDGVPILMHDDTLERTTNGHGQVADLSWEVIRHLDAGSWFHPSFANERVPRLEEALRLAVDLEMQLNVEIKPSEGRAKATTIVGLIEMAKVWPDRMPHPIISSMDMEVLEVAAQLQPPWPRCLILEKETPDWRARVEQAQALLLCVQDQLLTPEFLQEIKGFPLPVLAYTLNEPARIKELLASGVASVYTDNPAAILAALQET